MDTFKKSEKLCSYTQINKLFSEGKTVKSFPLKMIYTPLEGSDEKSNKLLISVPKRLFKRAVDRNRIKRIVREGYRRQKELFVLEGVFFNIGFIYTSNKMARYQSIYTAIENLSKEWHQIKE